MRTQPATTGSQTSHVNEHKSTETTPSNRFLDSIKLIRNTTTNLFNLLFNKINTIFKSSFTVMENPQYAKKNESNKLDMKESLLTPTSSQPAANFKDQPSVPANIVVGEKPTSEYQKVVTELSDKLLLKSSEQKTRKTKRTAALVAPQATELKTTLSPRDIYLKNDGLINQYSDIPNDQKADYKNINAIIFALTSSATYISEEGIFRKNGTNKKTDEVLKALSNGEDITQEFIDANQIDHNDLASAIKKLRNQVLTQHPNETNKLNDLVARYTESIKQKQATETYIETYIEKNAPVKGDRILQIATNNAHERFLSLEKPPLHLQICMPLFVKIARLAEKNQMSPSNISTSFGGGFNGGYSQSTAFNNIQHLTTDELMTLNMKMKEKQNSDSKFLEALITHELTKHPS